MTSEPIILKRDCPAVLIPAGVEVTLQAGTEVRVTQALGGSFTLATPTGMARVEGREADALGLEPPAEPVTGSATGEVTLAQVWEALKAVYDPEIPVNIVDLGLVYDCRLDKTETGVEVKVKMTLTAPGCGMGPAIAADAKQKVLAIEGVTSADVELVWDPPWNQDMMSEAGKMKLGLI